MIVKFVRCLNLEKRMYNFSMGGLLGGGCFGLLGLTLMGLIGCFGAAVGGMISGLLGAAKGQDAVAVSGNGMFQTQKKGGMDILKSGAFGGASNVGEKLAEFALKEAENMSPVLEVDPGVVVMPHILKGFYVGEKGMMKKLNEFREKQQKQKSSTRNNQKNG